MKISNQNNSDDFVKITTKPTPGGARKVYLDIGAGKGARHTYLSPPEARQVAYALLYYAEKISIAKPTDDSTS